MTVEDETKLITTIGESRSPALLPLFLLSLDTGMRAGEVRAETADEAEAKSMETNSGLGRIRTYDQRIMSPEEISLSYWLVVL